jgi:hypothetical protein
MSPRGVAGIARGDSVLTSPAMAVARKLGCAWEAEGPVYIYTYIHTYIHTRARTHTHSLTHVYIHTYLGCRASHYHDHPL